MPISCGAASPARRNTSRCSGASMTEPVGAELKSAREAQGLTVSEVAHQLKLAPRQVEALEAGSAPALAGGAFRPGSRRHNARPSQVPPPPPLGAPAGG